ncbi:MAG: succinate--CoA ligase subunit alpha [Dethiobacteria bacterium]|jgi:succinyl-CoA synthetase alpha subunit|nr:succinate--CoA ligase subunit alpha [Bacillota bacterium]
MSILLTKETRAIVQGVTGRIGSVQTKWMLEYGTNLVAGVTPGRGGEEVHGLPVYDDVYEAVEKHQANATVLFVPAPFTRDAVLEAIDAGIKLIVAVPEHVPVHDVLVMKKEAEKHGAWLLGPNTPGIISPGIGKLGIMPGNMFVEGKIGIISRSGTLSYEIAGLLNEAGYGQSSLVGVGGDPVVGTRMVKILREFEADPQTEAVVIVGEIGGTAEEEAAEFIKVMSKPVVGYIAGRTAPPGRRMGHAGAIISKEGQGTVESKAKALTAAGAPVANKPTEVVELLKERL